MYNGSDTSDIEMFIALVKSNHDINEQLFIKVYAIVQKWSRSFLCERSEEEYLDVIDEAFTRFFERKKDFRGTTQGEFHNYFCTILRTIVDGEKRKGSRIDHSVMLDMVNDRRQNQQKQFEKNEELDALMECIEKLPTSHRKIAHELLAGTKKGSIAAQMGISPSALSRNIHKILGLLRECLMAKGYSRSFEFSV